MMEQHRLAELKEKHPLLEKVMHREEVYWLNPLIESANEGFSKLTVSEAEVKEASERLQRFAPYLERVFPETKQSKGIIESPVTAIPSMKKKLEQRYSIAIPGELLLKEDNALPISGSIKARGGIYEVLKHAEKLALEHGLITEGENYSKFADDAFRELFSKHKIAVGSTGNLGLSIGIMSAQLGFEVTVHMSADAKQWKKDMLREKGVIVVEYEDDYSKAVEEGRRQAEADPLCHFVDDENSLDLFFGYAVAGERLAAQLAEQGTIVDADHPLFVYLPCGVGGGPGGVAYGLKLAFGDHVHCFFAEPTHSPCMLLGMMTGLHDAVSVHDFGLDNETAADGLAVGTASGFVGKTMEPLLSGCYTISDETMFKLLTQLTDSEGIRLEPSALAGMTGPIHSIQASMKNAASKNATHLVWATGGSMVPEDEMNLYYEQGRK
ncbi:D-serine ammonia-lyase [Sporosarcina pasteurii]|uniref:Probable D-serine dehydratase n=1 Tax=Sporosarcina pasteurii TaxID=1474 RepID=A0A380CJK2_SPOPA|nr:D-serine ammonia-lyase [Sporosarcina pasteurii]MDS9471929.1 D-serine ammonia-lyase [Sporosarcina pasteurii]QBQ06661.1 D-serine ammonia-lyase [Sporosarcina pasteurii]SUJ21934.1 D-serine dehydratase [Sporosarcina pasteurii]